MTSVTERPTTTAGVRGDDVEVRGVCKRFGDRTALDGVSFRIPHGTITGFVGNNGSGKTTAIRVITGLLEYDTGQVLAGGQPITGGFRSAIGYMPEERGLYPDMKVEEQLVYLARLYGMKHAAAAREVGEWLGRLSVRQYATMPLNALSLGNQQRVQLIAALLGSPRLVILDEPFSGLDRAAVAFMSEILHELAAQGVGIFFSSHQLDIVESICRRAVILNAGRVVAEGTVDELLDRGGSVVRVTFDAAGAPTDDALAAIVPGAKRLHGTTFTVPSPPDSARVLKDCLAVGDVVDFTKRRQSLSDIFAEVCRAEPDR